MKKIELMNVTTLFINHKKRQIKNDSRRKNTTSKEEY